MGGMRLERGIRRIGKEKGTNLVKGEEGAKNLVLGLGGSLDSAAKKSMGIRCWEGMKRKERDVECFG